MDDESCRRLAAVIRRLRTAALGTLREGGPLMSMILYAVTEDFSRFYLQLQDFLFAAQKT